MGLILDTNFLIAAERETRRGTRGITGRFLAAHDGEKFCVTFTVVGELACGQSAANLSRWHQLFRSYEVLPWTMEVSWQYGELHRQLQSRGAMIGVNDLWIAATALVPDMAVVTNNVAEFRRVEGLAVIPY